MGEASWREARAIAAGIPGEVRTERVPLATSDHRVLAEDVHALVDLPGFPTAAMDGWAVAGPGPWQIVGTASAGDAHVVDVAHGECVRIGTGAAIPRGCTRVIPWECAVVDGTSVRETQDSPKTHIRPRGEERLSGDLVARRGTRLTPVLIGHIAAVGHDDVCVACPPRIHLLVIGDEVVTAGVPGSGSVRDALGIQVPMWVARLGGSIDSVAWLGDDPHALEASLAALPDGDIILTTGGTARGHRDHVRDAWISAGGSWTIDGVAVRPGHPMMLGQRGTTVLVGLPGNPLSALVALVTLLAPVMSTRLGQESAREDRVRVAESVATSVTRLLVGQRRRGNFVGVERVSSAMLAGLANADGWAVVEPPGTEPGDEVEWVGLPW